MERLKNESGQALFLVMMVLMVLMLIGAAALTRTSSSHIRSFEQKKMVQSSYIAEAGVEKVLAHIKNDFEWLKALEPNKDTNYVFAENGETFLDYAGGRITSVKVTRTSTGNDPTTFCLESRGDYQGATRTINVTGEARDGITFAKGIWVNSATEFENKVECYCDIIGRSTLTFKNNDIVGGNIIAEGTVDVKKGITAYSIISGQDVLIESNLEVISQIKAGGNIRIDKGFAGGQVSAIGDIILENTVDITGDVYQNGELYMNDKKPSTGTLHKGEAVPFEVNIPSLPVIDKNMYSENPNQTIESGILSGTYDINGITYAPGDLDISGNYSGRGVIVVQGKVTISGDLIRANEDSCLVIIALGQVDGVGISSNNKTTYAHLFSPYLIDLNTELFYGSIICDSVKLGNKTVVRYDNDLYRNQPDGLAAAVKVKSWKEANPVF
ncbi:hypothetical protein Psfp_00441 [Pelotomaculum sp. FP]|uniref:hypothetical protein n=1 Tax=Pelotomaculum sp. FP TaxID=261474 RepID=UPI001066D8F7|nr:hypothetical protein [Pelotomaculum sp. FP]TEB17569.1 hypothetical protein Psfp_00441 [Pelotomaculum sp. FP]